MSSDNGNGNGRLTPKQSAFIEEYFIDFNATRAAERAGYRGDDNTLAVTGSRLLRINKVAERIKVRLQESAMSADEVLARLAEQARGEVGAYIQSDGTCDFESIIADDKAHLLKKVLKTTRLTKAGDEIISVKVEMYDAQRALELIGKYHKLFVDRTEHTGKDGADLIPADKIVDALLHIRKSDEPSATTD